MAFFRTILAAAWLLMLCRPAPSVAQELAPEDFVPPDSAPVGVEAAPPAPSPTPSAPPAPLPTPREVARASEEPARASEELELREQALTRELAGHPMALPGLAVGIGVPAALILVPIGALIFADGNSYHYRDEPEWYSPSEGARLRRVGGSLMAAGVLATAAAVYGSFKIHSVRQRRRAAHYELAAIRVARLVSGSGEAATPTFDEEDLTKQVSRQRRGPKLTSRGRTMLTGGFSLSLDSPSGQARRWNMGFSPGFAYFIEDHLALGAYVLVSRGDEDLGYGLSRDVLAAGGGVRLIYELPLGERLGLWLWPSFGVVWARTRYELPPGYGNNNYYNGYETYDVETDYRATSLVVGLGLPLVLHLTESWGLGVGPEFSYWIRGGSDPDLMRIALGAWFVGSF